MIELNTNTFYVIADVAVCIGPLLKLDDFNLFVDPYNQIVYDKYGKTQNPDFTIIGKSKYQNQIQEGKYYVLQSGRVIGPMISNSHHVYPFRDTMSGHTYTRNGLYEITTPDYELTIVKEYGCESPNELCPIQLKIGTQYIMRDGNITSALVPNSRKNHNEYPFFDLKHGNSYTKTGKYDTRMLNSIFDIIGEYIDISINQHEKIDPPLHLEVGKRYSMRNGQITDSLVLNVLSTCDDYPFFDTKYKNSYAKNGKYIHKPADSVFDIIGEHTETSIDQHEKTDPPLKLEVGKYYKQRNGNIVGPIHMISALIQNIYKNKYELDQYPSVVTDKYPFVVFDHSGELITYTPDGKIFAPESSEYDLVSEVSNKTKGGLQYEFFKTVPPGKSEFFIYGFVINPNGTKKCITWDYCGVADNDSSDFDLVGI